MDVSYKYFINCLTNSTNIDDQIKHESLRTIEELKDDKPQIFIEYCIQTLKDNASDQAKLFLSIHAVILLKNFLKTNSNSSLIDKQDVWFSEDLIDNNTRSSLKDVMFEYAYHPEIRIRNMCCLILAEIATIDNAFIKVMIITICSQLNKFGNENDAIVPLIMLVELQRTANITSKTSDDVVMSNLAQINKILVERIINESTMSSTCKFYSFEYFNYMIENFNDLFSYDNMTIIRDSCISNIFESNNISCELQSIIFETMFNILKLLYGSDAVHPIFNIFLEALTLHRSNENLVKLTLSYIEQIANHELEINSVINGLISNSCQLLIRNLLPILENISDDDNEIEDPSSNAISYFAYSALESIVKCNTNISFGLIIDYISNFDNVGSKQKHAMIIAFCSLMIPHNSDEKRSCILDYICRIIIPSSTSNMLRIRESAIYCLFLYVDSGDAILSEDLFKCILDICKSNVNSPYQIIQRINTILILVCKSAPVDIAISYALLIKELCIEISQSMAKSHREIDVITEPFIALSKLLSKFPIDPSTNEPIPLFFDFFNEIVSNLQLLNQPSYVILSYLIMLNGIAEGTPFPTDIAQNIVNILYNFLNDPNSDIWKTSVSSLISICKHLELPFNIVNSIFLKVRDKSEIEDRNYIRGSLILIGCIYSQCNDIDYRSFKEIFNYFITIIDFHCQNQNGFVYDALFGTLKALMSIIGSIQSTDYESYISIDNTLLVIMKYIPKKKNDIERQILSQIISCYVSIYENCDEKIGRKYLSSLHYYKYFEFIDKLGLIKDPRLFSLICLCIKFISQKISYSASRYLNRRSILGFLKEMCSSENSEMSKNASLCLASIKENS